MTGVAAAGGSGRGASCDGGSPAAPPPLAHPQQQEHRLESPPPPAHAFVHDRLFGLLACAMWGTWALKLAPEVPASANAQSLAGLMGARGMCCTRRGRASAHAATLRRG